MKLIIGLDIGKKTGIAKAYDELRVAIPYKTVYSFENLVEEVNFLQPEYLVVGLPLLMSGEEGLQCRRVRSTLANLIYMTNKLPVYYEDERFSTQEVAGSKDEDASSAAWILQRFLDKLKKNLR